MARPSSQMGLWRGSAPPDRAGSDYVTVPPMARVVPPCSVNERLRRLAARPGSPFGVREDSTDTSQPDRAGADCRAGE
jgi:hypothetical protein